MGKKLNSPDQDYVTPDSDPNKKDSDGDGISDKMKSQVKKLYTM